MPDATGDGTKKARRRIQKFLNVSEVRERERQALALAASGATLDAIAAQVGYSNASAARKAIRRALERHTADAVEELRDFELFRLDRLLLSLWPKALLGDLAALDRVLRIVMIRIDLLGLAAPKRIDVEALIRAAAIQEGLDPDEAVRIAAGLSSSNLLQLPAPRRGQGA